MLPSTSSSSSSSYKNLAKSPIAAIKHFKALFVLLLPFVSFKVFFCVTSPLPCTDLGHGQKVEGGDAHCSGLAVPVGVYVRAVRRIGFLLCRHRVPFDRSRDWLFETYLAAVIFQKHTRSSVTGKGVALPRLFSRPFRIILLLRK